MSIEEIIHCLDRLAAHFSTAVTVCGTYSLEIAGSAAKTAETIRSAIEKLKTHHEAQTNEPLTPEELRGMVGEWVWVTVHYNHCDCSGWAFVCTAANLGYLDQILSIEDCGTKFNAYRRPPKEETP